LKRLISVISYLVLFQVKAVFCQSKPAPSFLPWVGFWQVPSNSSVIFEQWDLTSRNLLIGKGFEIRNADTVVLEKMRIFKKGKFFYYEARVINQNQGKPVLFKMTECDNRVYRFENPQHDFPQMIQYTFDSPETFEVLLSNNPSISERKEIKLVLQKR
jgi:hypothetical protein